MIQNLTHELTILAKATAHRNLSAASVHVGLSQPQLSRVIAKIESELGVVLLDRSVKRKSGWTKIAIDLSVIFSRGLGRLESEIYQLAQDREPTELHIGTLEGVCELATQFAHDSLSEVGLKKIYLDVLDFSELESQFLSGSLDLIFTVRLPGKKNFNHVCEIGYQQLKTISSETSTWVGSPFELQEMRSNDSKFRHFLISNSLTVRKLWLNQYGGTGDLPVDTQRGRGKGQYVVYLIANENLSRRTWTKILTLVKDK